MYWFTSFGSSTTCSCTGASFWSMISGLSGLRNACAILCVRSTSSLQPNILLMTFMSEQVGDDAMPGLSLDVVEHHRAAAIHVLLQTGDLEIGIDRLVGLDQVALRAQPFEGRAQVPGVVGARPLLGLRLRGFFFVRRLLHFRNSWGVTLPQYTRLAPAWK